MYFEHITVWVFRWQITIKTNLLLLFILDTVDSYLYKKLLLYKLKLIHFLNNKQATMGRTHAWSLLFKMLNIRHIFLHWPSSFYFFCSRFCEKSTTTACAISCMSYCIRLIAFSLPLKNYLDGEAHRQPAVASTGRNKA